MCNRYNMTAALDELEAFYQALLAERLNLPNFDVFPGREAAVLCNVRGERKIGKMVWGVPPPPQGNRPVTNVRNRTSGFWRPLLTKPVHRCLVPVTRFSEWTGDKGSKREVWFGLKDASLFSFAGIWRKTADGPRMAFLACAPNALVEPFHPKAMPVILRPADYDKWLAGDYAEAVTLAQPYDAEEMEIV